ncbi:CGNR zinc finger domain-containing protein [Gordonia sp. NPDC003376]
MLSLVAPDDVIETLDQRRQGFPFRSGSVVLDLVATVAKRDLADRELLTGPDALSTWFHVAGLPHLSRPVTARHVGAARRLREALNEVVRARVAGRDPEPDAVDIINAAAKPGPPLFTLAPDAFGSIPPADVGAQALLSLVAREAIDLFTGDHADRIRLCRGHDCSLYFVDRSRLGNRAWCSMSVCGMKNSSARYRARRDPHDTRPGTSGDSVTA